MADFVIGSRGLEQARSAILANLKRAHPLPTLATVQEFVSATERTLMDALPGQIRHACVEASAGRLLPSGDRELVGSDGSRYELAVSPDVVTGLELLISIILVTSHDLVKPVEARAQLAAPSQYRQVRVFVPRSMPLLAEGIANMASSLLDSGYAWIANAVIQAMDHVEDRITARLYGLSTDIFPEQELREKVWFATVGPVYGFRLAASEVTREALRAISLFTSDLPVDPLDLLAELLSTRLPREMLLMDKAAKFDTKLDLNFRDAGYSRGESRYPFVLKSLYGGSSVSMMTLLRTDNFAVLALFPTGHSEIATRLEAHRQEFEDITRELSREIVEAASLFVRPAKELAVEPLKRRADIGGVLAETLESVLQASGEEKGSWRLRRRRSSQ